MEENANQSYKNSDAELNEVYREIIKEYYNSINYTDELCIAAAFLYKATGLG